MKVNFNKKTISENFSLHLKYGKMLVLNFDMFIMILQKT